MVAAADAETRSCMMLIISDAVLLVMPFSLADGHKRVPCARTSRLIRDIPSPQNLARSYCGAVLAKRDGSLRAQAGAERYWAIVAET
jgi:hypothetical protein